MVLQSVKMAVRLQQIAWIASQNGITIALSELGLEITRRGFRWATRSQTGPTPLNAVFGRRLAKTLVRLGPTFIKLGQMLATRPDLVGDAVADELRVLFDRVPPMPYSRLKRILNRELGKEKVKSAFQSIEKISLAAASLGQVHRVVLADGTDAILKVQRENVADLVRTDLKILEQLFALVDRVRPQWQASLAFRDFQQATLMEIDYREEAKNIERFQKNYKKLFSDPDVAFPGFYPELTTERVLVLEPMHGTKVSELRPGSTVARRAAVVGLHAVLEQIFDHGFFHADPHAGNLFFQEDDGRMGFIDLGLVGHLEPRDKAKFLAVVLAILQKDKTKLARALFDLGESAASSNFDAFEKDVHKLIDSVKDQGVQGLRLDQVFSKLLTIAREHHLHVPHRYVLMLRSTLMIEGVAKTLDPAVSLASVATPIVVKSLAKAWSPLQVFKRR